MMVMWLRRAHFRCVRGLLKFLMMRTDNASFQGTMWVMGVDEGHSGVSYLYLAHADTVLDMQYWEVMRRTWAIMFSLNTLKLALRNRSSCRFVLGSLVHVTGLTETKTG